MHATCSSDRSRTNLGGQRVWVTLKNHVWRRTTTNGWLVRDGSRWTCRLWMESPCCNARLFGGSAKEMCGWREAPKWSSKFEPLHQSTSALRSRDAVQQMVTNGFKCFFVVTLIRWRFLFWLTLFRWAETTHENIIIFRRWEKFTASFLGGTKIAFLFGARGSPRADGRCKWSFFHGLPQKFMAEKQWGERLGRKMPCFFRGYFTSFKIGVWAHLVVFSWTHFPGHAWAQKRVSWTFLRCKNGVSTSFGSAKEQCLVVSFKRNNDKW